MEKAQQARNENDIGAMKDSASLLATNYIQEYYDKVYVQNDGTFKTNYLTAGAYAKAQFLSATEGGFTYDVSGDILTVTNPTTGNYVTGTILESGNISWNDVNDDGDTSGGTGEINWDTIKATATKHGAQSQENTDIGIGPNGEAINLDLWEYNIIDGTQTIFLGNDREYEPDYYDFCYNGSVKEDIILPRSIKKGSTWYDVVEIGIGAFSLNAYGQNDQRIGVTIKIPDTITKIDDCAFMYSDYLSNITIPNSVTQIGNNCFASCELLEELRIPSSVVTLGGAISNTSIENLYIDCDIPEYSFSYASLGKLTIGNNCTEIEEYAFSGCSLKEIEIPSSVVSFGSASFSNNYDLEKVSINCDIPDNCFAGCSSLEEVTIGNNCTEIGEYAFQSCSALTSIIIPNSVTSIRQEAFEGCGLTSITIPNSVTSIGASAFASTSLQTLSYPNNLTTINYLGYFENATINLPSGITHIYYDAFSMCNNCTINFAGTRAQWNSIKLIDGDDGNEVSEDDGYELNTENVTIHCSDDT